MRIKVDGVGSVNKGAELMFFAILQELERSHLDAEVLFNDSTFFESNRQADYFNSKVIIKKPYYMTNWFVSFMRTFHIPGIAERINKKWNIFKTFDKFVNKDVDLLLNAAGFSISDKFGISETYVKWLDNYLGMLKKRGAKIVFLPQAFGPCENTATKHAVKILFEHADLIFAREATSLNYLQKEVGDSPKIKQYPDFTSLVKGVVPKEWEHLKTSVCLIPNMKMVEKKIMSYTDYISFWEEVIKTVHEKGYKAFILNHEGVGDEKICKDLAKSYQLPYVSHLNALETKGVISNSYLVVSSRFHGVASALSSSVPCLATSWSHKYQHLFDDYKQTECVLGVNGKEDVTTKISNLLDKSNNAKVRIALSKEALRNRMMSQEMWNIIWKNYKQ